MHIGIAAVGRVRPGPERDLIARYLDRARQTGRSLALTGFEVAEITESRAGNAATRRREEAAALAGSIPEGARLVVLDERGQSLTTEKLAGRIVNWRDGGATALAFVIGGADGLDAGLRQRADLVLGFSALTWPHQLVRVMLAEQLYRVATVIAGHPYHRGG